MTHFILPFVDRCDWRSGWIWFIPFSYWILRDDHNQIVRGFDYFKVAFRITSCCVEPLGHQADFYNKPKSWKVFPLASKKLKSFTYLYEPTMRCISMICQKQGQGIYVWYAYQCMAPTHSYKVLAIKQYIFSLA